MSWRHARAIIELNIGRPPVCALMMALAHHADEYSGQCWPSIERLCMATGFSRRAIQMAIGEAVSLGLILWTKGGNRKASVYTLTLAGAPAYDRASGKPAEAGNVHRAADAVHSAPPARHSAGDAPQHSKNNQEKRPEVARPDLEPFPLPENWSPTPAMIAQAKDDYPDVDLEHETLLFIDVNQRDGTLGRNWNAAWRAWIGRAKSFGHGRKRAGPGTGSGAERLRARARTEDRRSH